jgi:hypothetical protein
MQDMFSGLATILLAGALIAAALGAGVVGLLWLIFG